MPEHLLPWVAMLHWHDAPEHISLDGFDAVEFFTFVMCDC